MSHHAQEVITYVEGLKERVTALEKAQGLQPTCLPTVREVPPPDSRLPLALPTRSQMAARTSRQHGRAADL